MSGLISTSLVEQRIFLIRGQKVLIDRDLAELYRVPTFATLCLTAATRVACKRKAPHCWRALTILEDSWRRYFLRA